jgi:hypothetical protein
MAQVRWTVATFDVRIDDGVLYQNVKNTDMSKETRRRNDGLNIDDDGFSIDDEFRSLLPPLTTEDFESLERSIVADGCRDPLITWQEERILIDGHHRRAICIKHGIPYKTESKSFSSRDEVVLWILENQKGRRNMSRFQWAEVILKRRNSIATIAKEHQRMGGGSIYQKSDKPVHTLKILAKLAGISHDTMYKVSYILTTAATNPNNVKLHWQIEQLRKGDPDISISGVYKELRRPKNERTTKPIIAADDSTFDLMRDQWGDKEVLEQEGIIPKAKVEMSQGLEEQLNLFLDALEELEGQYPQVTDRVDIYNTISNWVDDKKRELARQSLK